MRTLLFIAVATILTGCASHAQRSLEHTARVTVSPQGKQQTPKYEYKVEGEWILGPTLKWPLKGSDGTLWTSQDGYQLLGERWTHGAAVELTADDLATIRTAVFKKLPERNAAIRSIKKITECEYMVEGRWYTGPHSAGALWFVFVQSQNKWILIGYYFIWIS